jgi:hypothetical protein
MVNAIKRIALSVGIFQLLFLLCLPLYPKLLALAWRIPSPFGIILNVLVVAGLLWASVEIAQRLLGEKNRGATARRRSSTRAGTGLDPADLDVVLRAKDDLLRIRRAVPRLGDPAVAAALLDLDKIAEDYLASLVDAPERMRRVRRPLSYHLPKAAELAEGLAAIGDQPEQQTRALRIAGLLIALADFYRAHRDGLEAPDARGLDVEIRLLESALKSEATARQAAGLAQEAG